MTRVLWVAVLGALLGPLLLVLPAAASPTPSVLCLAQAGQSGCIAGTIGSRANPVEGVDVTLLDADGVEVETQTSGADGKYSFTVTEGGDYLVRLDEDTLPEGFQVLPPADAKAGPDGSVKVSVRLGRTGVPDIDVRPSDFDDSTTSKADQLIGGAANGLKLGLLLALASVGLSLIYGTTGISNFAHAEMVTLGGMTAYGVMGIALPGIGTLATWGFDLPLIGRVGLVIGILATVVLTTFSGWLQDVVIWTPLRRRGLGLTQLMIVTIGFSLALQYAFQFFVGAAQVKVTLQSFTVYTFGPIKLTSIALYSMGIAVVVIALVGYVLIFTRVGQATRAVSDNPALAAASGIDVDRIVRGVWTVSAGLAGLSGVLYALSVSNGIRWDTGFQILLLLFAAVTLGGLGTAFGALIGSLIVGMVVELSGPLGAPGDLKYAVALAILIVLLVFRPQGLLGRAARVG